MKKILAILLAVIMCLGIFAGCKPKKTEGPQLADAVTYLESLYKDGKKETPADYDVVGKVMIDTAEFTVTWETDNTAIAVKASDKAGFYTIDVPSKTDAEIPYKLKATVKDADGNTQTVEFDRVVPVVDNTEIVYDLKENTPYKFYVNQNSLGLTLYATGETQNDKFLMTSTDPKLGADFYAEVVDGGYKFFINKNGNKLYVNASTEKGEDGKVSKFINFNGAGSVWYYKKDVNGWFTSIDGGEYVVGTYNSYDTLSISEGTYLTAANSGISQFPAGFMDKAVAEDKGVSTPNAGDAISATIAEILAMTKPSGAQEYIVEGTVDEVTSTTYGNMYIKDSKGNKLLVYGLYDSTGTVRYDQLSKKPVKGDKVKVQGPVTIFNDEVELKNAKLLEINGQKVTSSAPSGSGSTSTPTVTGTSDIKENTAYKLFMHQASLGQTRFALSTTDNDKFIKTDVDAKKAPDFYAEKSGNGFKFYIKDGSAKKYLTGSTQPNGEKISKFLNYSNTGSVWYYKKDVNAWFVKIDNVEYVLGTYGTYETLSLSEAKYITKDNTGKTQFPGEFVAKATAEAAKPSDTTKPNTGSGSGSGSGTTPATTDKIILTVDTLGIPSEKYTNSNKTVYGTTFEWLQLGNYGAGIQMRDKEEEEGKTTYLWNTTAFGAGIKEIQITLNSTKKVYDNADAQIYSFGDAKDNYTYTTKFSTTADKTTYTITPNKNTYKFFKLEHDLKFTLYVDSITIVLTAPQSTGSSNSGSGSGSSSGSGSGSGSSSGSGSGSASDPVDLKLNTAYKIVVNNGTAYYAKNTTQNSAGKFVETDANYVNAADYYAEQASGGWKFYTTISGAKKYLTGSLILEEGKTNKSKYLGFSDTGSVFKYNASVSAWYTTIENADYYMGTYGTWTTVSLSDSSYFTDASKRATQFEANFVESSTLGSGNQGSGSGDSGNQGSGSDDGGNQGGNQGGGSVTNPDGSTTVTVVIADIADSKGWENSKKYESINIDANITATVTGTTNSGKYYTSGENWRLYSTESATLTIEAAAGKTIKSVKVTYESYKTGTLTNAGTGVDSGTVVPVNGSSITFGVATGSTSGGQARVTAIEVIYA